MSLFCYNQKIILEHKNCAIVHLRPAEDKCLAGDIVQCEKSAEWQIVSMQISIMKKEALSGRIIREQKNKEKIYR